MSRPRSRSPVHPFRLSALKRRSPGRFEGHHYGNHVPLDAVDFELQRGFSGRDSTWLHGNRRYREDRQRIGSAEQHRTDAWRRARSPGSARTLRRSPPPGGFPNRLRTPPFAHELGYAERRRLSPGKWTRSHEWRSNSRRKEEFHDDFQGYPEDRGHPRGGIQRERLHSPGTRYEGRPARRLLPFEWDKSSHSNYREEHNWSPNREERAARGHSSKDRSFHHLERKERCVEEEAFADFGSLLQHSAMPGRSRSPGRARIIVEHDHGISHPGQASQDYHSYHGRNQRHFGEAQPRGDHQDRPPQGRRSPSPQGQKQQEALQTRAHDFLNRLAMDANGDVDLRQVGPGLHTKKKAASPPQSQVKATGRSTGKGEHTAPLGVGRGHAHETLTIKVDTGHSAHQRSPSQFSLDRQLSLDLISVGRQRLDFLPASEQSGVHGETPVHSGTFAQEIITLVHQVKEHYLKGPPVTLNERFSAVHNGQLDDEGQDVEEEEEKSGSSSGPRINRRIDMSLSELKVFQKVRCKQKRRAADDPSDLRYDLERRRQERLEEVRVTIPGVGLTGSSQPLVRDGRGQNKTEVSSQDGRLSGPHQSQSGSVSASRQWGPKSESDSQIRPGFVRPDFGVHSKSTQAQNRTGMHWPQDPNASDRR